MKAILLIGTLAANLVLVAALALRPTLAPPRVRDFLVAHLHSSAPGADAPVAPTAAPKSTARRPPLWSTVQTDDMPTLVARLRAAGFPASIIRAIVNAEISKRFDARFAALREADPNVPFWKLPPLNFYTMGDKRIDQLSQLQQERSRLLRDLFKDEAFDTEETTAAQRRQFGDLSRTKIEAIQRIEDDYSEMLAAVRSATNGVELPEDRQKFALLNNEKKADLAAVLTPEELSEYLMRSSPITGYLRRQLGDFDASEAEFRAIFQTFQNASDRFTSPQTFSSLSQQEREEFTNAQTAQLKAALGEARYADYVRESDSDFRQLSQIGKTENVSHDALVKAYDLKSATAAESNRIYDDATLSVEQKRTALAALAKDTRSQISSLLGPSSSTAYLRSASSWLRPLEQGSAISFESGSSTTVVTAQGTFMYTSSSRFPRTRSLPKS